MADQPPEPERRIENQRLAYYKNHADAAFWDEHWKTHLSREAYTDAERGNLGMFEKPFARYLPRQGRILEAGCGLGQLVLALRVRGYDAEGVEWGSETVRAVRELHPDLPIRVGDVTRLGVPDATYSAYISLGVVEHRSEGPEPFLQEAHRVLAPGGVALISVPYFHALRRLKARLRLYRGQTHGLEFYQYAFAEEEFTALLKAVYFDIVDQMAYDGLKGLKDEIPLLRQAFRLRVIGPLLQLWLQRMLYRLPPWRFVEKRLGHMLLVVCRKDELAGWQV